MNNGIYKVVSNKKWLKDSIHEVESDLKEEFKEASIHVVGFSLSLIALIGLYRYFEVSADLIFKSVSGLGSLVALRLLIGEFISFAKIAIDYDNDSNRYLELIEELEDIDPEDEDIIRIDQKLKVKH